MLQICNSRPMAPRGTLPHIRASRCILPETDSMYMYNTIYILPERQIHCLQYVGHSLHHCGEHSWSERAWRRGLNPAEDYQMNSARPEGHTQLCNGLKRLNLCVKQVGWLCVFVCVIVYMCMCVCMSVCL